MKRKIKIAAVTLALAISGSSFAATVPAQAYLHLDNCQSGLRYGGGGDVAGDDDIHAYGVYIGASAWGGWAGYERSTDTSLYVDSYFLVNGVWKIRRGRCAGNDGQFNDYQI